MHKQAEAELISWFMWPFPGSATYHVSVGIELTLQLPNF